MLRLLSIALFIGLISNLIAQKETRFIGLVNSQLVEINPNDPSLSDITFVDLPAGNLGADIAYSPQTCLFYTTIDATNNPKLVSFDFQGKVNIIAEYRMENGDEVFTIESIAYNSTDGNIYVSGSLNGQDFFAESLLGVNTTTARCSLVTTLLYQNNISEDIDNMVIANQRVYYTDGIPGDNRTDYYVFDLAGITATTTLNSFFNSEYLVSNDLIFLDNILYLQTLDRRMMHLDLSTNILTNLGTTHTDYNQERIIGSEHIEDYTTFNYNQTLANQSFCISEQVELSIEVDCYEVLWSTGDSLDIITVNEPGIYQVSVLHNDCPIFISDSITISFASPSTQGEVINICNGPVQIDSLTFDEAGVFEFTFENQSGCDSIVTYFVLLAEVLETENYEVCEGEIFEYNNEFITETGIYPFAFTQNQGCDSVVIVDVIFNESFEFFENISLCPGDSIEIDGQTYSSTTEIREEFRTTKNCDSIFITSVTVSSQAESTLTVELCPEDNQVIINDITYTTAGDYVQSISRIDDCDSLLQLSIVETETPTRDVSLTICAGVPIEFLGITLSSAGDYLISPGLEVTCDSLFQVTVTEASVYLPNVISQNDPTNDSFRPYFSCDFPPYTMQIYDRWGNLVFESNDPLEPWKGRINNNKVETGVYTYVMQLGNEGQEIIYADDLLVID